jgi:hypothetical protein
MTLISVSGVLSMEHDLAPPENSPCGRGVIDETWFGYSRARL